MPRSSPADPGTATAANWLTPSAGRTPGSITCCSTQCDSSKITEIELDFKLNELILRFMTTRIEQKWLEEMKAVAPRRYPAWPWPPSKEEAPSSHAAAPTNPDGTPMEVVPVIEGAEGEPAPRRRTDAPPRRNRADQGVNLGCRSAVAPEGRGFRRAVLSAFATDIDSLSEAWVDWEVRGVYQSSAMSEESVSWPRSIG